MKKLMASAVVLLLGVACGGDSFSTAPGGGSGSSSGAQASDGGKTGKAGSSSGQAGSEANGGASSGKSGSSSGGHSSGGATNGGASSGGTSNGGTSNGGSSSGGLTGGGVTSGGATSGGMSTGGSATGGATACEKAEDCVACAYPTAPKAINECYCTNCNDKPMAKTACEANQVKYQKVCANAPIACTDVICEPPPAPNCEQHMCVAGTQK